MGYKMKGFSGFKDSPAKAADANLVKAADNMSRGLKDPTSLVGEGVVGFLEGYAKTKKASQQKELTEAIKGKTAYDELGPPSRDPFDIEKAAEETKKSQGELNKTIKSENPPTELDTVKIKPRYKPQNEKIIVSPPKSDKVIIKEKVLKKAKKKKKKK